MKNKVFIIHGWGGSPQENWFPYLKEELGKLNCEVVVPTLPGSASPELSKWLPHLREVVGEPQSNFYFVGHSLGAILILRYLEQLSENQKIAGAIFVAGFPESIDYKEIDNFFTSPLDYEKIKKRAGKFIAINSDNDSFIPLKNGEILRDKLGAELVIIRGAGHFNGAAGFYQLPIVLAKLKELFKNDNQR